MAGGLQPEDQAALHSRRNSSCNEVTLDTKLSNKAGDWKGATFRNIERNETDLIVADPFTGEVKKTVRIPYPNVSGALATAGGLVFTGYIDGTFVAYDDASMEPVVEDQRRHRLQCAADDVRGQRQAICRDPVGPEPDLQAPARHTPELREMRNQTMLFVFGL